MFLDHTYWSSNSPTELILSSLVTTKLISAMCIMGIDTITSKQAKDIIYYARNTLNFCKYLYFFLFFSARIPVL